MENKICCSCYYANYHEDKCDCPEGPCILGSLDNWRAWTTTKSEPESKQNIWQEMANKIDIDKLFE